MFARPRTEPSRTLDATLFIPVHMVTPPSSRALFTKQSRAGRRAKIPAPRLHSHSPKLTRPDQVHEDIPFLAFQDRRGGVFANPDLVTLDDDFRAVDAIGTERDCDSFHSVPPPFVSMCGQI